MFTSTQSSDAASRSWKVQSYQMKAAMTMPEQPTAKALTQMCPNHRRKTPSVGWPVMVDSLPEKMLVKQGNIEIRRRKF